MAQAGFLDFQLFPHPPHGKLASLLRGTGKKGVLVVVATEAAAKADNLSFLESILGAAQLTPTAEQVYRLDLAPDASFTLAQSCRQLKIKEVLMFGDFRTALGLRAQLSPYAFTRLGEVHYLLAHDLDQLRAEREQGKKQHAAALWQALKTRYL